MNLAEPTQDSEREGGGFAALRLGEHVLRALEEIGYSDPTPVQAATYPLAVAGRDIIVQARTGTGKTAAFGIPLVDKLVHGEPGVQALVLAPTRELALQSQREIARLGQHRKLHVVAIYGGAPMGRQIDELRSGAQIVSGTPGRVLDHLRRGTLDASKLRVLILDEMDEMLSMGFAKELNAILELIPDRHRRQTMCFSATVDGEVRRHAERHMNEPEMVSLSSDAVGVEQITHYAYMVSGRDRTGDIVRILEVEDPESAIIFCNMRSETERVAGALKQAGFNADWLNGDLPQRDRERIMEDTRQGRLRYLVATDVAARGIDISHLTHVVNYTFPESAAVYVHRTGRTGRAGRTGCAVSLVSPDELGRLYYLRLEYKISPIERSLPTTGELTTRHEIDRVLLLDGAFSKSPSETDRAIARRLLTHPDVERILGGLLHTFFGTHDEVDEEAAAARRTRNPQPVEPERSREPRRGREEGRGREREVRARDEARPGRERDDARTAPRERTGTETRTGRERDDARTGPRERTGTGTEARTGRERDDARTAPRERTGAEARTGRERDDARTAPRERTGTEPRAGRERDDARERRGPTERRDHAPGPDAESTGAAEREPREDGASELGTEAHENPIAREGLRDGARPGRRRRRSRDRGRLDRPDAETRVEPASGGAAESAQSDETTDAAGGGWEENDPSQGLRLSGILYLNLGRRDGVRISEVAKLLRDSCELSRSEVGRIRIRDRYTFVDVPEERLPSIIEALAGHTLHDKPLAPERGKTTASTAGREPEAV